MRHHLGLGHEGSQMQYGQRVYLQPHSKAVVQSPWAAGLQAQGQCPSLPSWHAYKGETTSVSLMYQADPSGSIFRLL